MKARTVVGKEGRARYVTGEGGEGPLCDPGFFSYYKYWEKARDQCGDNN